MITLFLLVILALAPALDLAGDGPAVSSGGPVTALDFCSIPGLLAPPAVLSPLALTAGTTETVSTGVPSFLARPLDHPPQPS